MPILSLNLNLPTAEALRYRKNKPFLALNWLDCCVRWTFPSCKLKSFSKGKCRTKITLGKKSQVKRKKHLAVIVSVFFRNSFSGFVARLRQNFIKPPIFDELFDRFAVLPSNQQNDDQGKNSHCACGIESNFQIKLKTCHFAFRREFCLLHRGSENWSFLSKNPYMVKPIHGKATAELLL